MSQAMLALFTYVGVLKQKQLSARANPMLWLGN